MESKVEFEVLMSVMHQNDFSLAEKAKVNSDLLIINQCDKEDYQEKIFNGYTWRMISTTERGLSKSRNMALKNAKGEICLLADDDELFSDNYREEILKAYKENKKADVIVFNLNRINFTHRKKYYKITKIRKAPFYRSYQSGMISLFVDKLKKNGIYFNENFGSGTPFGGGEESILLNDIRKKYLKIYENPFDVATLDYSNGSQWFKGFDEKYFYNSGAFNYYFYKGKRFYGFLRKVYTCFWRTRISKVKIREKFKLMRLGAKGFKGNVTYSEFLERSKSNK